MAEDDNGDRRSAGNEPHQHEPDPNPDESWKSAPPYQVHDDKSDDFHVQWTGQCHCGAVKYELGREKPLACKYCHCTACQRLHGAPFQWAAIFHKTDIRFANGHRGLAWYAAGTKTAEHRLPCKVQCAYCRTPIMDEGRKMVLLFPTLVDRIHTPEGREAFAVQSHMFYPQRVVDVRDGKPKFAGLSDESELVDEETGEVAGA